MASHSIYEFQRAINDFMKWAGAGWTPLTVDGNAGELTGRAVWEAQWLLGYHRSNIDRHRLDNAFWDRMHHPWQPFPKYGVTRNLLLSGWRRRIHRRAWVARNVIHAYLKPGVGRFDGKPVAKCLIPVLSWCRQHDWHGQLVSGWRSGPYSEHLCYIMCGHPTCPGRCAGRDTNHTGDSPERCAADVSQYEEFRRIVAECPIQPHIRNALPKDRVHFSPSGR